MISDAALDDLRARNPVSAIAGKWVNLRRASRAGMVVGPCPICSTDKASRAATRFECDADKWVCAACPDGGDVIRLVERAEGLDFRGAVAWLGGAREIDPEEERRRADEAARKKAEREATSARYREDERLRLFRYWKAARPIPGTLVEDYLALRTRMVLPPLRLRFHPTFNYYVSEDRGGRQGWRAIHTGPAMLAPIVAPDGHFIGLHITWLDLAQPKGKALIVHPDTGEVLVSKKVRGTKQGGRIELIRCSAPYCLVMGEGIETGLSVYAEMAEARRPIDGIAFWAAGDLGNLAGKAARDSRERHPTAKDKIGRAVRVPGAVPDFDSDAVVIPDSVTDLRLLADADSDRFTTGLAMDRAAARHAAPGRRVTVAWPDPDLDFNDMRMQVT